METNENNLTDVQKNTRTTILSLTNNFAEKRNEYIKKAEELKKEALELEKTTNGDYEYTEGSLSFNKALIKGYILGTYYGKAISALENSISIEIFKVHLNEYDNEEALKIKQALELYDHINDLETKFDKQMNDLTNNLTPIIGKNILDKHKNYIIINDENKNVGSYEKKLKTEEEYDECYKISILRSEFLLSNQTIDIVTYQHLLELLKNIFNYYQNGLSLETQNLEICNDTIELSSRKK